MRRIALIVVLACFWVTVGWGCSGETDTTGESSSSGTGAGGSSYDGGLNDGSSDAPDDVAPPLDGGQSPVYLGLSATAVGRDGGAPRVVAKGVDHVAQRIKQLARESEVLCFENVPLARALHARCEIGDVSPEDLFEAVAVVLAYVYRVQGERLTAAV